MKMIPMILCWHGGADEKAHQKVLHQHKNCSISDDDNKINDDDFELWDWWWSTLTLFRVVATLSITEGFVSPAQGF